LLVALTYKPYIGKTIMNTLVCA